MYIKGKFRAIFATIRQFLSNGPFKRVKHFGIVQ